MKRLYAAKSDESVPVEISHVSRTRQEDVQVPPVDLYENDEGWILVADVPLSRRDGSFRLHVMPVAVGVYLPAELSFPILMGGLVHWLVTRNKSENGRREKRAPES